MNTKELGQILFGFRTEIKHLSSGFRVGTDGPIGVALSPARPSHASGNRAKYNAGALVIDMLIDGKIACLKSASSDMVFAETEERMFLVSNSTINYDADIDNKMYDAIALTLHAICNKDLYPATARTFAEIAASLA